MPEQEIIPVLVRMGYGKTGRGTTGKPRLLVITDEDTLDFDCLYHVAARMKAADKTDIMQNMPVGSIIGKLLDTFPVNRPPDIWLLEIPMLPGASVAFHTRTDLSNDEIRQLCGSEAVRDLGTTVFNNAITA